MAHRKTLAARQRAALFDLPADGRSRLGGQGVSLKPEASDVHRRAGIMQLNGLEGLPELRQMDSAAAADAGRTGQQ